MLSLCISEPALRDAVLEQITASGLTAPHVARQPADLKIGNAPDLWLIDEADYVPATLPPGDAIILLLGASGHGDSDHRIAETFARPLRLGHLMTRLRAWCDGKIHRDRVIEIGPLRLDPRDRTLARADTPPVKLTEKEVALIAFLARQTEPVPRRDLLAEVWGYDERIDTHTLETHIYQLRRKLDSLAPDWLLFDQTGYRLADPAAIS